MKAFLVVAIIHFISDLIPQNPAVPVPAVQYWLGVISAAGLALWALDLLQRDYRK